MKLKSFRTSLVLVFTTLMLMLAAATPLASAQTYKDLHNFGYGNDGFMPRGFLAQVRGGFLFGTAQGGTNGCGVVFRITPRGKEEVFSNFHQKLHHAGDGCNPTGGLSLGLGGNLLGTATYGGDYTSCTSGCGTIVRIKPSIFGSLTVLYAFNGNSGGLQPLAPPILGSNGNFYGTTSNGKIYKITPSGSLSALAAIVSSAPLLLGTDGNFYGTSGGGTSGDGIVFQMTPQGTLTIIFNFDGTHGASPNLGALIQGLDDNFYGATQAGGTYNEGVVFQLTPQGAITVLHNFGDPSYANDGVNPHAGLVQATDGNFYGVTSSGGTLGHGVIFQVTSTGNYSILYNFDGKHGANPESTPMQHTNGMIYGLTTSGGKYRNGVAYSFDMGLAPFVSLVSPPWGKVGKVVELLGQGFTGTTVVSFNGTAAAFTVVSSTYLTATVPDGATTGFVTVTTPGGILSSSKKFRVEP